MHEITLCQRALELIEQQATQHGAKRVTAVWLKIGAFSCVETSALAFCLIWYAVAPLQKVVNSTSKNKKPNVGVKHASSTSPY